MNHRLIRFLLLTFLVTVMSAMMFAQPTITAKSPAANALDVSASSNITITFSGSMSSGTLNSTTIKVIGSYSGVKSGSFSYDNGTFTTTFNPTNDFKVGEVVTVTVTTGVENAGNVSMADPFSWSFTVEAGAAAGTFSARVDYSASTAVYKVTAADLNGDGFIDIVTPNTEDIYNSIAVLLNNGNGTFAAKVEYTVGYKSYDVAAADVDNDGDIDLMTANRIDQTVSVLLNNGNGTFSAKTDYAVGDAMSLVATDFDGDGDADLAVANGSDSDLSVLLNNGNGTFATNTDYSTGDGPTMIISGDIDNDGDMDVATGNGNDLSVLKNNGDGTFAAKVDYFVGGAYGLVLADIDGDGDLDLISTNTAYDYVSVFKNNGNGTFAAKVDYTVGADAQGVSAGDIDGDGDLDIISANGTDDDISVLKNNGNGTFAVKTDYASDPTPLDIAIVDADNDGILDVITTSGYSEICVFLGNDPLPVELVSFAATNNNTLIELQWKTATEINNYGFEVERRLGESYSLQANGSSDWQKIGFVEGSGTSNAPKEYVFSDKSLPSGKQIYRLKQIDRDGTFEYSQEVEITIGAVPKKYALEQNYPNPFNPATTIGFTLAINGLTTLKIYDIVGREVATLVNNELLEAGVYHQKQFDARSLASGIYFARLVSGGKVQMKKMSLIK